MINEEEIKNFESDNGFVAISLPEMEKAEIIVEYTGTSYMYISKIISITTLMFVIVYVSYKHIKKFRIENVQV